MFSRFQALADFAYFSRLLPIFPTQIPHRELTIVYLLPINQLFLCRLLYSLQQQGVNTADEASALLRDLSKIWKSGIGIDATGQKGNINCGHGMEWKMIADFFSIFFASLLFIAAHHINKDLFEKFISKYFKIWANQIPEKSFHLFALPVGFHFDETI